jgi:hypothetical protein
VFVLTKEQQKAREGKLTGSVVKVLMTGTDAEVLSLWRQMLGMEEPPSLENVWPVRLGEATEALNLAWYARKVAPVTRIGEVVIGPEDWMAATLDGFDATNDRCVECKHVGGRESLETIVSRYTPQCTWQMICTETESCALSVIAGANEPVIEIIPWSLEYSAELVRRGREFMAHVENLTPPVYLPKVEPPPLPAKDYDMADNGSWKQLAARWVQAFGAAQIAKECEIAIKKLVPEDAKTAFGAGIIVTKNRAGAMALREMKA